ncbi:sensor histidine kinase [Aeromicrobium endophyticum]|uniref:Sensor-like histidine kinase SenX3 n=1 Tax=Aeromicrobium endophyticum TaxID=2292704 RepID=A0A371PCQ1_9ACTN|nr:GAF domain-containing sensor histidine kinase [Aeromicrobium endophyticum]REK73714.1 GHKL domain-containing protein [Aeromicrobium endophyticum]
MSQDVIDATVVDHELERYRALDQTPGRDLQSLVDLIAQICDVPHAAINLISSTAQHQIVAAGFEPSVCARDDSMCAIVMGAPDAIVVADASVDERFKHNPFVTGEIGSVRFYASAPIITPDGVPIGRLCVFDLVPRELSPVQRQALGVMASQVMDLLELRFRSQALEESLQELTRAQENLRRSNEHLSQFADQVSHDLRTPLTAILVNAELLATEPVIEGDADVAQMVEAVEQAGHRMDAMIQQMLSFAQQGGRPRNADVDLAHVLDLVLKDVAPLSQRSEAQIVVGELPRVVGDADLIYSVLLNLMTNAIKFARPNQRPEVTVRAERRDRHWRIRVDDNGIGVAEDRRESMFEIFTRDDHDRIGHGIGLATARRIVEAHDGTIGMDASPSGGTSVWFDLPL